MNGIFSTLTDGDKSRIAFVLILILANYVFAVIGSVARGGFDPKAGGFDWHKLPKFFTEQILPYVVGLAFFEAFLHLLPPSELAAGLTASGGAEVLEQGVGVPQVATPSSWTWLDPATLWAVYSAMVAQLLAAFMRNVTYLFGKGIEAAQKASGTATTSG